MIIPGSTYRVQLHAGFNMRQLESILDYLNALGITTIYASPITTAISGSMHGYDVTDPLRIDPEIGTIEDLERIAGKLREKGMSWIQDIVPNHMAYGTDNPWLFDALERGTASVCYRYFDIGTGEEGGLTGDRLMAPFLGKTLTEALQAGEISLQFSAGFFRILCNGQEWPVAAQLYRWIVTMADGYPYALAEALQEWEEAIALSPESWSEQKKKWAERVQDHPQWLEFFGRRIDLINGKVNLLEELLQNQHYIFTHYHLSASRINYRRFFTVNSLICLRMEEEAVFGIYHRTLKELYDRGLIQGLRIDHIDGLASPREYIGRLRKLFGKDCYIVVEKILAGDESLPADWDIQGATGYEFLALVNRLLTDGGGVRDIVSFYKTVVSEDMPDYRELVWLRKLNYLKKRMGGEWDNITELIIREYPDADKERLKESLGMLMAAMPVYRLYPGEGPLTLQEEGYLQEALAKAREKSGGREAGLAILEKAIRNGLSGRRLMQFTGPLAAKGIEDASFYIYDPLISHNEVGDSPSLLSIEPAGFHSAMEERLVKYPHALNAGTTHDTKRGEDSRIRLNYLSAIPSEWRDAVKEWMEINRILVIEDDGKGRRIPSLNDEYFIYQSILGGFPSGMVATDKWRERVHGWLTKALREADTRTEYEHPDSVYEEKTHAFLTAILEEDSPFLENFIPFAYGVIRQSELYSLSQLALKLTAPGIPDIYQGSECWELSFVDPDNRLPVDYSLRREMLSGLEAAEERGWPAVRTWLEKHERKGAMKLYMIRTVLKFRRRHPELFSEGEYIPVEAGAAVLGFVRRFEGVSLLVLAPLMGAGEAVLPEGGWVNLFTGAAGIRQDDLSLGLCLYYASSGTDNLPGI